MVVTHYTGALRTLFHSFVSTAFSDFPFSSIRFCLLRRARFFWRKEIVILLPSNKGICSTFCIFFQVIRKTKTILRLVL